MTHVQLKPVKPPALRILIVDDERDILVILAEFFQKDGWKVFVASDGSHALRIMSTEKFDAVLTDLSMPRMGGLEFIGHAKAQPLSKKAKFFIMSGNLDSENLKRITSIGVASVILKPFDGASVVKKLKEKCMAPLPAAKAKTSVSYDANIVRGVTAAMQGVVFFYLGDGLVLGKPYIKSGRAGKGFFSALIPLSQGKSMGSVAFSCNINFLRRLAASIFGENQPDFTDELIRDLAGEMCNQISGKIKINLAKIDYYVNIGLPQVIVGENHEVSHPGSSPVIAIPMSSNDCNFSVEFTMNGALSKGKPEGEAKKEEAPAQDLSNGALFF